MSEPSSISFESLVQTQKGFFKSGHTRALEGRLAALVRFEEVFTKNEERILQSLEADLGKPSLEAFLSEYFFVLQELRLLRKSLKKWLRPRRVGSPFYFWPCRNEVRLEPHGTVLVIAPWNYPIQLSLAPVLAAVAAGNTVILKPSEEAPACATLLEELVKEAFDSAWVTVVQGEAEVTASLLENRFDFLFFTGSTRVGKLVAEKAARQLTPTLLELGGKCPCVVDASADLPMTARRILIGKLFNAGQTCFAPDFVAVAAEVKDALLAELQKALQQFPWEKEMGRIVNEKHYQRLQSLCSPDDFQKGGDDESSLHLAPRIAALTDWDAPQLKEEIFGPILPVIAFNHREELFEKLAEFAEPLALYCFSKENEFFEALTTRIPSGGVCLNDVGKQASHLSLPFGGKGESGYGRYRGKRSVEALSYERAYTKRYFFKDLFESLPPRGKQEKALRKWMK